MENKQINNPSRSELITDFVKTNPEYYIEKFQQIGRKPTFSFSFNLYAASELFMASISPSTYFP